MRYLTFLVLTVACTAQTIWLDKKAGIDLRKILLVNVTLGGLVEGALEHAVPGRPTDLPNGGTILPRRVDVRSLKGPLVNLLRQKGYQVADETSDEDYGQSPYYTDPVKEAARWTSHDAAGAEGKAGVFVVVLNCNDFRDRGRGTRDLEMTGVLQQMRGDKSPKILWQNTSHCEFAHSTPADQEFETAKIEECLDTLPKELLKVFPRYIPPKR
jgi:hypothetical protein